MCSNSFPCEEDKVPLLEDLMVFGYVSWVLLHRKWSHWGTYESEILSPVLKLAWCTSGGSGCLCFVWLCSALLSRTGQLWAPLETSLPPYACTVFDPQHGKMKNQLMSTTAVAFCYLPGWIKEWSIFVGIAPGLCLEDRLGMEGTALPQAAAAFCGIAVAESGC